MKGTIKTTQQTSDLSLDSVRVDRTRLSFATHAEAAHDDMAYWLSVSHEARWQAVELQQMIAYGYETPPRLQRFLEIA
jgi:hypothetical protein